MTTRKQFEKIIIEGSDKHHSKGYVLNNEDNLIDGISLDLFHNDLMQGSGNELVSKFNALYSSSALAVNNFAIVKKHLKDFKFMEYSDFEHATFERQFKTGLSGTPPNLDFVLENDDVVIAFESKYLEVLNKKEVLFKDSYNNNNLPYLDDFWFKKIKSYTGEKLYLDVAQLIKHAIGLTNYRSNLSKIKNQRVILVYIYWTPNNSDNFNEYVQHSRELVKFNDTINNQTDIEFISMTYNQFWNSFNDSPLFKEHFDKIKTRYDIKI
jgi:hypothetical protein